MYVNYINNIIKQLKYKIYFYKVILMEILHFEYNVAIDFTTIYLFNILTSFR